MQLKIKKKEGMESGHFHDTLFRLTPKPELDRSLSTGSLQHLSFPHAKCTVDVLSNISGRKCKKRSEWLELRQVGSG